MGGWEKKIWNQFVPIADLQPTAIAIFFPPIYCIILSSPSMLHRDKSSQWVLFALFIFDNGRWCILIKHSPGNGICQKSTGQVTDPGLWKQTGPKGLWAEHIVHAFPNSLFIGLWTSQITGKASERLQRGKWLLLLQYGDICAPWRIIQFSAWSSTRVIEFAL